VGTNKLKPVVIVALACLFIFFWTGSSHAQLTPGTVTVTGTGNQYCPTSSGFYNPGGAYTMTCYQGTVTCSQAHPVATATINWEVINAGASKWTVVMFGGGGGTSASSTPGEESTYVPGMPLRVIPSFRRLGKARGKKRMTVLGHTRTIFVTPHAVPPASFSTSISTYIRTTKQVLPGCARRGQARDLVRSLTH
jgi:hypothetical protein